jgi:hypothetical protein
MVVGATAGTKPRAYSAIMLGGSPLPIFDVHPNAVPVDPDSRAPGVALALHKALRMAQTARLALVIFRSPSGLFRVWLHTPDYEIRYDRADRLVQALSVPEPPSRRATEAQMMAAGLPAEGESTVACALLLLRLFRAAGAAKIFFELDYRPWSRRDLRYRLLFRDFYNGEVPRRYLRAANLEQILLSGLALLGDYEP